MEITVETLSKLDLHSLRKIGREIGVKAPTTLYKKELIAEIIKIKNGEKQPYVSKKGRPTSKMKKEELLLEILPADTKKLIKKEFINTLLKEIEKKLYELL